MNRYLKLQQCYYKHCYQYQSNKNLLLTIDSYFSLNLQNDLQKFSEFEDPEKHQGSCPSSTLIRKGFLEYFENNMEEFCNKWMHSLSGQVLSSDHTFKIALFVWSLKH